MYTNQELKKMPRARMLEAMREMNHPYVAKLNLPPKEIDEEMDSRAELDNWIQKADTTKEDSELDIDEE